MFACRAGTAFETRKTAMATMMTSTIAPAAVVRPRKPASMENRALRGSAPPPPSGGRLPSRSSGGIGETPLPADRA
ncbi:hypothetical protein GCM10020358_20410 [Amorphoplanes nipponensis]|uniref:Uncharacterized protein n=1 Tax=Actinoplanes nipponensis TaxID=135950 RepID=A0A919JJG5_9ACTN|nr:hypothetical protein Ani05nite_39340 [Actinoplanes nipponensis]